MWWWCALQWWRARDRAFHPAQLRRRFVQVLRVQLLASSGGWQARCVLSHVHTHKHTRANNHTHTYTQTHTHTHAHTYTHMHTYTYTHKHTHVQTTKRTHVHTYTYTHTHTHTHTHTNIRHRWTMADRMYSEYEETLGRKWVPSGYSRPTTGSEVHRYSVFTTGLFCSLAGLFCRKISLFWRSRISRYRTRGVTRRPQVCHYISHMNRSLLAYQ